MMVAFFKTFMAKSLPTSGPVIFLTRKTFVQGEQIESIVGTGRRQQRCALFDIPPADLAVSTCAQHLDDLKVLRANEAHFVRLNRHWVRVGKREGEKRRGGALEKEEREAEVPEQVLLRQKSAVDAEWMPRRDQIAVAE